MNGIAVILFFRAATAMGADRPDRDDRSLSAVNRRLSLLFPAIGEPPTIK